MQQVKRIFIRVYYGEIASNREVTFNSVFSLTQKFKVPNINADVVDTGNSHALEAVNEFFKRSFEINCLLAIKKLTAQVIGQSPLRISVNDFEGV